MRVWASSFFTFFRFLLLELSIFRSLGLWPIDMEKTGLILIVVRRYIGLGVKAKKGEEEKGVKKKKKIWKASLIHQNRGDTATGYGSHSQQWQSLSIERRINRACGKTHGSLSFLFLSRSHYLAFRSIIATAAWLSVQVEGNGTVREVGLFKSGCST